MTSNIGSDEFTSKATQIGFNLSDEKEAKIVRDYEKIKSKITENLDEYFLPEFINRIDKVLVFNALNQAILKKIVVLHLEMLTKRLTENGIKFSYDSKAISHITKETYNPQYGARPVRRYIQERVEDEIANILLSGKKSDTIHMSVVKNELKIS
jgi:ATP-dependent Clp protease ATP-binding subunit ClpA